MTPRFEKSEDKKMIGKKMSMTFSDNKTAELWKSFMPLRHTIKNKVGNELYSMQSYSPGFFERFDPTAIFEKWAAVEVSEFGSIPEEMDKFILPSGLYAVFMYKGDGAAAAHTFEYIFRTWLPNSEYQLDNRPHFELLGPKYQNAHPDSEEEIWIPVYRP